MQFQLVCFNWGDKNALKSWGISHIQRLKCHLQNYTKSIAGLRNSSLLIQCSCYTSNLKNFQKIYNRQILWQCRHFGVKTHFELKTNTGRKSWIIKTVENWKLCIFSDSWVERSTLSNWVRKYRLMNESKNPVNAN